MFGLSSLLIPQAFSAKQLLLSLATQYLQDNRGIFSIFNLTMKFTIATTLVTLALATMGLAAPTANPSDVEIVERSPAGFGEDSKQITKRTLGLVYICPA